MEPIRFTVDYRTKHKDIFEKIHAEGVNAVPHHTEAMRFNCTGMSGATFVAFLRLAKHLHDP